MLCLIAVWPPTWLSDGRGVELAEAEASQDRGGTDRSRHPGEFCRLLLLRICSKIWPGLWCVMSCVLGFLVDAVFLPRSIQETMSWMLRLPSHCCPFHLSSVTQVVGHSRCGTAHAQELLAASSVTQPFQSSSPRLPAALCIAVPQHFQVYLRG